MIRHKAPNKCPIRCKHPSCLRNRCATVSRRSMRRYSTAHTVNQRPRHQHTRRSLRHSVCLHLGAKSHRCHAATCRQRSEHPRCHKCTHTAISVRVVRRYGVGHAVRTANPTPKRPLTNAVRDGESRCCAGSSGHEAHARACERVDGGRGEVRGIVRFDTSLEPRLQRGWVGSEVSWSDRLVGTEHDDGDIPRAIAREQRGVLRRARVRRQRGAVHAQVLDLDCGRRRPAAPPAGRGMCWRRRPSRIAQA